MEFTKKSNHYCGMSNQICTNIINTKNIESGHTYVITRIIFYNND